MLVSLVRNVPLEMMRTVGPDNACFKLFSKQERPVKPSGPYGGRKAVGYIISQRDRLVLGLEAKYGEDRSKDFFLSDLHVRLNVAKDRRLDEVTMLEPWRPQTRTPHHECGTSLHSRLDVPLNTVELVLTDQRP